MLEKNNGHITKCISNKGLNPSSGDFTKSAKFTILRIIYGISLIRLKESVGMISWYAGLLEIIGGYFLITIVLAFIGLIIYIPAELIEIIKSKQTENNFA